MNSTLRFPGGTKFEILRSGEETGGASVEIAMTLPPGTPGPPLHIHPQQEERYAVKSGVLELHLDGQWHELEPGAEITIPAGRAHTYRNTGAETAEVLNAHHPALSFEPYLRSLHRLAEGGHLRNTTSPKSLLLMALVWHRHADTIRPSAPLLRALFPGLALLAHLLGYEALLRDRAPDSVPSSPPS